eukprot:gene8070-8264_t
MSLRARQANNLHSKPSLLQRWLRFQRRHKLLAHPPASSAFDQQESQSSSSKSHDPHLSSTQSASFNPTAAATAAARITGNANHPQSTPQEAASIPLPSAAADQLSSSSSNSPAPTAQLELITQFNQQTAAVDRLDVYKAIGIGAAVSVMAGVVDHDWVEAHQGLAMTLLFCLGYFGIIVEEFLGLNKAGVALLMAVSLWVIRSTSGEPGAMSEADSEAAAALASVSELIFFLLGAMTVVEVVDCHGGFKRLASWVTAEERSSLAWSIAVLTFFMSAVLDNLTTTIVMRAVPADVELRKVLGAVVVIAANAGGAWTPIGDVTTTMLWIHGQITAVPTMRDLVIPSFVSLAVPLALLCAQSPDLQGPVIRPAFSIPPPAGSTSINASLQAAEAHHKPIGLHQQSTDADSAMEGSNAALPELKTSNRDLLVLSVGVAALLFVPVFKHLTGLPPYLGMLSGLAVLWLVTDALHFGEDKQYPQVQDALRNLDIAGVMFFFGILMSVEALNAAGLLSQLAEALAEAVPNVDVIAGSIGLVSALIDNVPLVAATMGMYDVNAVPQDSQLWQLIALCAGTGGSLLVIGSAAGVAYMGLEGSCGYGTIWRDEPHGWDVAAITDYHPDYANSCGACFEISCDQIWIQDNYGQKLDRTYSCYDSSNSVVVRITDTCPCTYPANAYSNKRWCCNDMDHFDVSVWAWEKLADKKWGVIGIKYRQVPCGYKPEKPAPPVANASPYPAEAWGSSRPTRDWPDFAGDSDRTYVFMDGQGMPLASQPPQPQNGWWDNSWNSWLQPAKDSQYSGMRKGQAYCGSIKQKGAISFKTNPGAFQGKYKLEFWVYVGVTGWEGTAAQVPDIKISIRGSKGQCNILKIYDVRPDAFEPMCQYCADYFWRFTFYLPYFAGEWTQKTFNSGSSFSGCGGNMVSDLNEIEFRNDWGNDKWVCLDRVALK